MRITLLLVALLSFAFPAFAEKAPPPPPQAGETAKTAKAAALVFDPTNLLQNLLQVFYQLEEISKQVEQIRVLEDTLEIDEDILDSATGIRNGIATLVNSPEHKAARRYMPTDWLCAMNVGNGDCLAPQAAFSQHAGFLNEVMQTPQAGELYTLRGTMAPELYASYYWSQNSGNAAMASAMSVSEQMDQTLGNIEELMEEIRRGHAKDIKGSTDLNTRAVLELATQQTLTNRLLSQLVFMEGMNAQRDVANVSSAAAMLRRFEPVAATDELATEIYP